MNRQDTTTKATEPSQAITNVVRQGQATTRQVGKQTRVTSNSHWIGIPLGIFNKG